MSSKTALNCENKLLRKQLKLLKSVSTESLKLIDSENSDNYVELLFKDGKFVTRLVTKQQDIYKGITQENTTN